MPAVTFARFFANHGLLEYGDQPTWRTVDGGSARYVDAILGPAAAAGRLRLATPVDQDHAGPTTGSSSIRPSGPERFDHVVVATHSDQALDLLSDPAPAEREVLGAIRYQPNRATLHTDARLLPGQPPGLGQLELPPPAPTSPTGPP